VAQLQTGPAAADTLKHDLRFKNGVMGTYAVTNALPGPRMALEVAGLRRTIDM
jgi:hypothetical protein